PARRPAGAVSQPALRAAGPADLPMILRSERDYMSQVEPEHLGAWLDAIDRNLALWIASLGRTLIAVVDGGDAMGVLPQGRAPVITIHVQPAYRRRGIGNVLLSAVASAARRDGAVAV